MARGDDDVAVTAVDEAPGVVATPDRIAAWMAVAKAGDEGSRARLATILYTAAEALRGVAVLFHPVIPATSQRLWASLGAEAQLGPLAPPRRARGRRHARRATIPENQKPANRSGSQAFWFGCGDRI